MKGIVEAVEKKVLDNLPGLAGMYMMQQQSLLSVLGLQGMVPVQQQMQTQIPVSQMMGMQQPGMVAATVQVPEQGQKQETITSGVACDNQNYTQEDVKKYEIAGIKRVA